MKAWVVPSDLPNKVNLKINLALCKNPAEDQGWNRRACGSLRSEQPWTGELLPAQEVNGIDLQPLADASPGGLGIGLQLFPIHHAQQQAKEGTFGDPQDWARDILRAQPEVVDCLPRERVDGVGWLRISCCKQKALNPFLAHF